MLNYQYPTPIFTWVHINNLNSKWNIVKNGAHLKRPCIWLALKVSKALETFKFPDSSRTTTTSRGYVLESSPNGPLTFKCWPSSIMVTFEGTSMGLFPILDSLHSTGFLKNPIFTAGLLVHRMPLLSPRNTDFKLLKHQKKRSLQTLG